MTTTSLRRRALTLSGALTCAVATIVACTGEDPDLSRTSTPTPTPTPTADANVTDGDPIDSDDGATSAGEDARTEDDAGQNGTGRDDAGDDDAGHDAGPELTSCSGALVDTKTNPDHCGACGHDCAGGACVDGTCQPFTFIDNLTGVYGVTTGGDSVIWVRAEGDTGAVESCRFDGCADAGPTTITEKVARPYEPVPLGTTIVSDGPHVRWIARRRDAGFGEMNNLFGCAANICETPQEHHLNVDPIAQLARYDPYVIYIGRNPDGMGSNVRACRFDVCVGVADGAIASGAYSMAVARGEDRIFYSQGGKVFRCIMKFGPPRLDCDGAAPPCST